MSLKLDAVHLSFAGRPVVQGVSLEHHPGEVVGLLGPNGAGKTTTFNLVTGMLQPDRGVGMLITDHNVRETLSITDYACILTDGRILASGSADELAADAQVKQYYLGEDFKL